MKHPRPMAAIRAGRWPHSPRGTTYVDVISPDGATCTLLLEQRGDGGSMMVQLLNPKGLVHLCSPVQCVWSSANPDDIAALDRANYYRIHGRYPNA
jgi:hypothetical protein